MYRSLPTACNPMTGTSRNQDSSWLPFRGIASYVESVVHYETEGEDEEAKALAEEEKQIFLRALDQFSRKPTVKFAVK